MRVSQRGQVTIPKHLRDQYGLHHDVEIDVRPTEEGLLILKKNKPEHPVDRVYGILGQGALGKDATVDDYIEDMRGR